MNAAENESVTTLGAGPIRFLLASIFVVAGCAILYQLLIGTASSFFLGNSVQQFSLTIGVFLASIGLGAFLSRFVVDRMLERFILVELLLGLFGAESVPLLYLTYAIEPGQYTLVMLSLIVIIGALVGFELPLLTRIVESRESSLRTTLANVMSIDYLGALAAALLFPFVLLPVLGVFRGALTVGLVNFFVGVAILGLTRKALPRWVRWKLGFIAVPIGLLIVGELIVADRLESRLNSALYDYPIVLELRSRYQQIIMTRQGNDVRLYLDGGLQFSSVDEARYHEALVHPAMSAARNRERVLVIGGGDGLAVRELLKYDDVKEIVLVDIDPEMTWLGQNEPLLTGLNRNSLNDPRVTVINEDAFVKVLEGDATNGRFGVILSDLPDPHSNELSKMYTVTFYRHVRRLMPVTGVLVVQSSSPYLQKRAYWCIARTIEAGGFHTYPYHIWVPSFEEWGFVMATPARMENGTPQGGAKLGRIDPASLHLSVKTGALTDAFMQSLFAFPKDLTADSVKKPIDVNRLDDHALPRYYAEGLADW